MDADVLALDHLFRHGFFDPEIPMVPTVRLQFKELFYLDLSFGQYVQAHVTWVLHHDSPVCLSNCTILSIMSQ